MNLESKILNGLERLSEVFKSLLWEKAKVYGISPLQIQILLFTSNHRRNVCNVSYLAKEFGVSKATISDAVKVLLRKEFLEKDHSPTDNRRYDVLVTVNGQLVVSDLSTYSLPISHSLEKLTVGEQMNLFGTISKLIFQLNQTGIIQVQRTCYNCQHYTGDKENQHFCELLQENLQNHEIRLDCAEFVGSENN